MLYTDEFQLVSGKYGSRVLSLRDQRDHPEFHQWQMQKQTSVMVYECISANSMRVLHVWRYHLHGGIYWGCTVKYTAVKMLCFMGSPWLLDQDCMYNSVVSSTQSECATGLPAVLIWLLFKCMTSQQQTAEHLKPCFKRDWTKLLLAKL